MRSIRKLLAVASILLTFTFVSSSLSSASATDYATRSTARSHPGCQRIEQAFLNVGATPRVAQWFAYRVAPGESGCVPQRVWNRTDHSYSTIGLNGKGGNRRVYIKNCGHDVTTWTSYEDDAKCGLWALHAMGPRAWSLRRYGAP